ncbi:MAG: hypothetical protein J5671_04025 [Bacteroidaceae bacterium]|nr:hypothetical protein [Bacteroidaceae bacterium]
MLRKVVLYWLLLFAPFLAIRAQEVSDTLVTYTAQVVEDETGEALPLVGVYVSNDNTTLTNFDGEFSIKAHPNDTIRLTCVGRKTLYMRASKLPAAVRMSMLEGTLSEVTIKAVEGTLIQASRQMQKAYNRRNGKTARYFYRQTSVISDKQDIVEAFIRANSAVNLRNIEFLSGRHGKMSKDEWEKTIFSYMNLHHVLEIGAMTMEVPFWSGLLCPLMPPYFGVAQYQKIYDITMEEVNSDDQKLYRITLRLRPEIKYRLPYMEGTLYVERGSLRTLAFDGKIKNVVLIFKRSELESSLRVPIEPDLHIDYRYDHGYPEVAALSMQSAFDNFQTRSMMFNMGDQEQIKGKKGTRAKENMITSIGEAGYDSVFWAQNEVIKRTAEEQRIADGVVAQNQGRLDSLNQIRAAMPPLDRLADRLKRFGNVIPQEKVFLHMDNTCYFLGDTIWFAAYTRSTLSDKPSRISRVLYVELLNHDGFLVERKLVEMKNGRGSGYFALPDTLYSGYFELRAYTRWQLNWGQTEHFHTWATEYWFYNRAMAKDFFRDYEKLYSRVFPVYDKPKEEGDFYRDMTLRPLRRYFKTAPKPSELRLSLFPEGGNLVAGVPCNVAFEAAMSDGEVRDGELQLLSGDTLVTKAVTENRGRGSFTFTPVEGKKYQAVFATADGKNAKQTIKAVKPEGVALHVCREDTTWQFTLNIRGKAAQQPLGLTIMCEGRLKDFRTIEAGTDNLQFSIPTTLLDVGVNQVSVFDSIGHIYADRLFFAAHDSLICPTLSISGQKEYYEPFELVTLGLQSSEPGSSTVSLAVRDSKTQDNTFDTGNILTEMLLASEIKGFVPHPEWFFESNDQEHQRALDLLMLTQGWRRFNWQDMAVAGAWDITHPAEHTQIVTGTVNRYWIQTEESEEPEDVTEQNNQEIPSGNPADGVPTPLAMPNEYGKWNMAWNMNDIYQNRSNIGAISDTHNGIYSMQGRSWQDNDYNALNYRTSNNYRQRMRERDFLAMRRYTEQGNLKKEVRVHAEFTNPADRKDYVVGEVETKQGTFRIDLPYFYGDCVFFLAASDTTKWHRKLDGLKKRKPYQWVKIDQQTDYDKLAKRLPDLPEYYVRLNFPYPRWVKPYTYYQVHNAPVSEKGESKPQLLTDGTHMLDQITVRARHGGLRSVDYTKPAYVIDAYEAANMAMDAGLIEYVNSFSEASIAAAAALVSDMGMYRHYNVEVSQDSHYGRDLPPIEAARYDMLTYIDKLYIYTDYSPRREGDERYEASNQPPVRIDLRTYPNWEQRVNYRDRRYILHGYAYQEDFYNPDYHRNPPSEGQKDYRRTLYWNPDLQLNEQGQARIRFFNNSQQTRLQVEAEGIAPGGTLLFNR